MCMLLSASWIWYFGSFESKGFALQPALNSEDPYHLQIFCLSFQKIFVLSRVGLLWQLL